MRIGLTLLLLFAEVGFAAEPTPLERLRAKVLVEQVAVVTFAHLAGKYSDPTGEFSPGLSGNDLYLFPDGTYLYDEWADIHPLTIHDKGKWRVEHGAIILSSDKDITWKPTLERKFIAVSRDGHPSEILLVGITDALVSFEEAAGNQPELELMIFAKERVAAIGSRKAAATIRNQLMRTAWNPAYFRDNEKK